MRWIKRLACGLVVVSVVSTTALADIPEQTVIIGNKAYHIDYANDEKNIDEISQALMESNDIVIRTIDDWYTNNGKSFSNLDSISKVVYTDKEGRIYEYREQNGERVSGEIIASGILDSKTIKIFLNQKPDMKWLNNKENFSIGENQLSEKDEVIFNEKDGSIIIKLNEEINTGNVVGINLKNITNEFGEIISDEYSESAVVVNNNSELEKLNDFKGTITLAGENEEFSLSEIKGNVFISSNDVTATGYEGEGDIVISATSENVKVNKFKCRNLVSFSKSLELEGGLVDGIKLDAEGKETTNISMKTVNVNEVRIQGNTSIKNTEGSIKNLKVLSESKVELEGTFETVNVFEKSQIEVIGASEIKNEINVYASAKFKSGEDSKIKAINLKKNSTSVEISGKVEKLNINENVNVDLKSADIGTLEINAKESKVVVDKESKIAKVKDNDNAYEGKEDVEKNIETTTSSNNGNPGGSIVPVRPVYNAVKGIVAFEEIITLNVGMKQKLTNEVIPSNATNKKLIFESSDAEILTVNSYGEVIALKEGEATITTISKDNNSIMATTKVIVDNSKIVVKNIKVLDYKRVQVEYDREPETRFFFDSYSVRLSINEKNVNLSEISRDGKIVTYTIRFKDIGEEEYSLDNCFKSGSTLLYKLDRGQLLGISKLRKKINVDFDGLEDGELSSKDKSFKGYINENDKKIFMYDSTVFNGNTIRSNKMKKYFEYSNTDMDIQYLEEGYIAVVAPNGDYKSYRMIYDEIDLTDFEEINKVTLGTVTYIKLKNQDKVEYYLDDSKNDSAKDGTVKVENGYLVINARTNDSIVYTLKAAAKDADSKILVDTEKLIENSIDVIEAEKSIVFYDENETMSIGEEFLPKIKSMPIGYDVSLLSYEIEDTTVLGMVDGKITSLGAGKSEVLVKNSNSEIIKTFVVEVQEGIKVDVEHSAVLRGDLLIVELDKPITDESSENIKLFVNGKIVYSFVQAKNGRIEFSRIISEEALKTGDTLEVKINHNVNYDKVIYNGKEVIKSTFKFNIVKDLLVPINEYLIYSTENSEFNGEIDNQNREVIIYEDLDLDDILFREIQTAYGHSDFEIRGVGYRDSGDYYQIDFTDGKIVRYNILRKKMEFKVPDNDVVIKLGNSVELEVVNSSSLEYDVEYDNKLVAIKKDTNKITITPKKSGDSRVKLTAQARRTDGSIIKGKLLTAEIIVASGLNDELITVEAISYNKLAMRTKFNFDTIEDIKEIIEVSVDGNVVEIINAYVKDKLIYVEFDNYSKFSKKVRNPLKANAEITLKYDKTDTKGLTVKGKDVENFKYQNRITFTPEGIEGESIKITNKEFNGEIDNEEKEIVLFTFMDPKHVMDSIDGTNNSELFYIGGSFFGAKKVALIAPNGEDRIYKLKQTSLDFGFETNRDEILNVSDVEEIKVNNDRNLEYIIEIDNDEILEVEKVGNILKVNALKKGEATIKISAQLLRNDGSKIVGKVKEQTKKFEVSEVPVRTLSMKDKVAVEVDEARQLYVTVNPENATHKELTWTSSDESIVVVNEEGIVTGKGLGSATITATSVNGVTVSAEITVIPTSIGIFVDKVNNKILLRVPKVELDNGKKMIVTITNKENGNLELIQEYELSSEDTEIELKLDKGVYNGTINIVNSRRYTIKTFYVE